MGGVLGVVALWWLWQRAYWGIVDEDRIAEWLTVLVYVAVCALSVVVAVRLSRHGYRGDAALYVLFAVVALFVAGEEASWFQRQVGFSGPEELVERNEQGEANLHNLVRWKGLYAAYFVVALYASLLARWVVPRLPVLRIRPWLYAPPLSLAAWFACAWIYFGWTFVDTYLVRTFGPTVGYEYLTGPALQEVVELALAGGFLLFVLRIVYTRRPSTADLPQPPLRHAWNP